jgi:hypothetical protein
MMMSRTSSVTDCRVIWVPSMVSPKISSPSLGGLMSLLIRTVTRILFDEAFSGQGGEDSRGRAFVGPHEFVTVVVKACRILMALIAEERGGVICLEISTVLTIS